MKRIILLSCFVGAVAFAGDHADNHKPSLDLPPDLLKGVFTVTSVKISTLNGYIPSMETSKGVVKLPPQSIDSLTYAVRVDSNDEKFINEVAKDDYGIKGLLVCNNLAIRPLIMSKNAVVLVSVENKEGEPISVTLYDSKSCKKKSKA
ncbi:hypothetical protein [Citrobacter sp. Cpa228]|uniref:hypothetical protein n=1 Tax=Citrobacter sp. Cpa228 TaxID=2985119 RepID=UPI00257739FF|nr:hypothetical protein [Citrobacter sp. Cpa228]MDM2926803.1 hypothetical protein [Citrobacter sp. Cpa228]